MESHIVCGPVSRRVAWRPATKPRRSIEDVDYSRPLRLNKVNYDVPTLDQLARAEKLHMLRACGYQTERLWVGYSPVKCIKLCIARWGECKYFTYTLRLAQLRGKNRAQAKAQKKIEHEQRQLAWYAGGREAAYLKKHPFGCISHEWFTSRLSKRTGLDIAQPTEEPSCSVEEVAFVHNVPIRQRRRYINTEKSDMAQSAPDRDLLPPPPRRVRSIMLLTKLRAIIARLRVSPATAWSFPVVPIEKAWVAAEPQMEGLDGDSLNTVTTSNVVLTEANPGSIGIAAKKSFAFDWHNLCTTETDSSYDYLLDRWTLWKVGDWKVQNQPSGYELKEFSSDLPYDLAKARQNGSMPFCVPFKIHKYYKSDIEVKIHINSNKFQIGQLQLSWQYMEKFDANKLDNIYSRSQLPHVLVNAGSSNEATLYIPYKNIQPLMHTSQRKDAIDCLYMGTLKLFVVAQLAVASGGPQSCGVSIFVRFPNAVFTGMRDGAIADPEMEAAAAAMVASAVVDRVIGDKNCDNPTNTQVPNYLVPTASHSWCHGTGVSEKLHSLRLDGTTIGVGRPGIDNSDTSIGVPCRVFGMLKHFEWSTVDTTANVSGYMLWSCDAHAQIDKTLVYKKETKGSMTQYAMPPVSVISSLFRYWRGSLEFKFDIVASQFHTGRLLCAYIPGFYGDAKKISIWEARNCPHIEFSLQDATSFTFTVPYISNAPVWPRRYTGPHKYSEIASPSKLVIFVLNPLVVMSNVVNKVVIIPYMRAGTDFEVSVPVQPSIGLSDCIVNTINKTDMIFPTSGSYPFRSTNYEGFGSDKKLILYEGTAAFGTASTFHAPEKVLKKNEYYYGKVDNPGSFGSITYLNDKKETIADWIGYVVLWSVPDKGNYGVPFPNTDKGQGKAKLVAKMLKKGETVDSILNHCYDFISDGSPSATDFAKLNVTPVYETFEDGYEMVEPQMEDQRVESSNQLAPTGSLATTSSGGLMFNERFDDLKDLARRYQLYADKTIVLPKGFESGETLAVFPAIPHGLDLDVDKPSSMFNMCRDGHIPIISSGYIFFRGSLRFKILFASDCPNLAAAKIWIQHHPDSDCRSHVCETYPNIQEEDAFKSHSYSFYVQNASVNSLIEFEVPFYQPGMYGLTRKMDKSESNQDLCQYYSLGSIVIGAYLGTLDKKCDINMKVYYSIGDDFSFNVFRGFPPVVFTDEVWPSDKVGKKKKITWITAEPQMEDEADPQMMNWVKNYFVKDTIVNVRNDISKSIKECVDKEMSSIKSTFKDVYNNSSKFTLNHPTVHAALSNLMHVIANPTPKTLAISIANVLVSFLAESVFTMCKLIEAIGAVLKQYWNRFFGGDTAEPQGDDDDGKAVMSLCGLIFTAVSCMAGVTIAGPSKFPDILRNINSGVSLYNNSIRLVQNSADLIVYCIKYITCKLNPEHAMMVKLMSDVPEIQAWYKECTYLLDVRNKSKYLYDKSMMSRVFDAGVVGNLLVSSGLSKNNPAGRVIFDTNRDVRKLATDLFERGAHPDVRFETFPIWMSGRPGIGKSFLVSSMVNDLLGHVGYNAPGSLIYYIPSGAKYWSGCQNPAALVSDDLFQVRGTRTEDEIANIFMICSSSVLNPPMAAVEDKERRLNPLLYVMLCNSHFPEISDVCNHPQAVYRRRKFLIEVDLADHIDKEDFIDASHIPAEQRKNFGHLKFRYAYTPTDPGTIYEEWMTYETLMGVVKPEFKTHYFNERENFKKRMCNMYCLDPDFNETNIVDSLPQIDEQMSLKEQIEAYKDHIRDQLDRYNDPQRDPDAWDYLRKYKEKIANLFVSPQGDDEYKARELFGEVYTFDHVESENSPVNLEVNYPDFFKFWQTKATEVLSDARFYSKDCGEPLFAADFLKSHCFIDGLAQPDTVQIEIKIQEMFDNMFRHKELAIVTWYSDMLHELQSIGCFDVFDYLKFFALFPRGFDCIIKCLFNIGNVDHPRFLMDLECDAEASFDSINNEVKYHNELKKKAFKKACWALDLPTPADAHHEFIVRGHHLLFCELRKVLIRELDHWAWADENLCNSQEYVFDMVVNREFSIAMRELNYVNMAQAFKAFLDRSGKHFDNGKVFYACLRFWFRCLNLLILADFLFRVPSHHCESDYIFRKSLKDLRLVKFCSVRRKLEYMSREFSVCKNVNCLYNNDLLYYFVAYGAVGCGRITLVTSDWFGSVAVQSREFQDVSRALRVRQKRLSEHIFFKFGRWLKHVFYHVLPNVLTRLYNGIVDCLPRMLVVLGLTATITAGAHFAAGGSLQGLSNYYKGTQPLGKQSNYFKFDNPKFPIKKNHPSVASKTFRIDPQMSGEQKEAMRNKIENNTILMYACWYENGIEHTRSARCLALRGRTILVLRHYIEEFAYVAQNFESCKFILYYVKQKRICKVSVDWEQLTSNIVWAREERDDNDSNFGLLTLPNHCPMFKNFVKYLANKSDHTRLSSTVDFYSVNGDSADNLPLSVKNKLCVNKSNCSSEVRMSAAYAYPHQGKGLCGSVIVSPNLGTGFGAVIGIHVAGTGSGGHGTGFAEAICREDIESFFEECPQPLVQNIPCNPNIEPEFKLDTNLMVYGCVPPSFSHKESGKTKITPSLLHGEVYEAKTEVNPLKPGDDRQPDGSHPLRDGCNKHGEGRIKTFEFGLLTTVTEHMKDYVRQCNAPVRLQVSPLTLQQAVCGDVNHEYFESLNWKSSEGFPLSSHRPSSAHDKRWLFDLEEGQFGYELKGLNPKLDIQLKLRDKCFKENIKPPTIYVDCLKDYRLSIEKCKIPGKTRIFSIAPVQCSIDIRTYLTDFTASIKKNRISNGIGIGINPDSMEWTKLVSYLHEVGTKIITLDYSNYGPCLMSQVVAASNEVISSWHIAKGATPEHVKRVEWLLDCDILNPVHLAGNVVYQTVNGIASGSPLTGECNSIPNLMYIRLIYLEIMRDFLPSMANMADFENYVRLVVYGDDLIMCVSDKIIDYFNAIVIREYFDKHGITVTSAQKSQELTPYTDITQATFLKRSFAPHPHRKGTWLAPIEKQSIEECINWMHVSETPQEATLEVCRASLDLAFGQGPEYYKQHYEKIVTALNKIGLKLLGIKDWYTRDREIFDDKNVNCKIPTSFEIRRPWTTALSKQTLE